MLRHQRMLGALVIPLLVLTAQAHAKSQLADEYVQLRLHDDPTLALGVGLGLSAPAAMHLPDRSAPAIARLHAQEDVLLANLRQRKPAANDPAYSVLLEELESLQALRVCRTELWDLSHMQGWQVEVPTLVEAQPLATEDDRKRVEALLTSLPAYLRTDEANLRYGLAHGYSVPKPVVTRVLRQLDGLVKLPLELSPFYAAVSRTSNPGFQSHMRDLIEGQVLPAIRRYSQFLLGVYLPQARESIGLVAMPNGIACYQAELRRNTTTSQSPATLIAEGKTIVATSNTEIEQIGARLYDAKDVKQIVARSRNDRRNRFVSAVELVQLSREMVAKSEQKSRSLFLSLPSQPVEVRPLPAYQAGSGVSSHYQSNPDLQQPATFWIATDDFASETRGAAELTAVHETVPGHHLQMATARQLGRQGESALSRLAFNAAYSEGWANYAERLAEEQGIDDDVYERIQRRIIAGRSLVIDPGIHAFAWTRKQSEEFLMETGMTREQADDTIDRIAVEPGQLTSYEAGGLEILALREQARMALGASFDLRQFHQQVLASGPIPLSALRTRIEAWIANQLAHPHS